MRRILRGLVLVSVAGCGPSIEGHSTEWATPVAPELYEVNGSMSMEMTDAPDGMGAMLITLDMCVTVASDSDRGGWIIRQGPLKIGMNAMGIQGAGGQGTPSDFMAPVLLDVNGGTLTEHDGPTKMWTAFDSLGGLVWFWPDLPSGATGTWTVPLRGKTDAIDVELRRGQSQLPAGIRTPPMGTAQPLTVPTRWKSADTLTATWSQDAGGSDDVDMGGESITLSSSGQSTGEGTWVIRDGTLEEATVHQVATVQLGMSGLQAPNGLSMTQTHTLDLTARRVTECSQSEQTTFP